MSPLAVLRVCLICTVCVVCSGCASYRSDQVIAHEDRVKQATAGVVRDFSQAGPGILASVVESKKPSSNGGWLIISEEDWELNNCTFWMKSTKWPKNAEDVAYIVVVGKERQVQSGYWTNRRGTHYSPRYVPMETLYLVDWKHKTLIGKWDAEGGVNSTEMLSGHWAPPAGLGGDGLTDWLDARGLLQPRG